MLDKNDLPIERDPKLAALILTLWVFTSVASFLASLTVRAIAIRIYAHFSMPYGFYSREYMAAQALGAVMLVIMGIVCIGVTIGCGEYHLRHFGKPQSWRLFERTIAAEVAIFVLASFV
ncbi:MAG: hypothetical protein KKC18_16190 [Chloroflexi bacterium]|nr:hypothetical protein [Chloroflexota bacterium]